MRAAAAAAAAMGGGATGGSNGPRWLEAPCHRGPRYFAARLLLAGRPRGSKAASMATSRARTRTRSRSSAGPCHVKAGRKQQQSMTRPHGAAMGRRPRGGGGGGLRCVPGLRSGGEARKNRTELRQGLAPRTLLYLHAHAPWSKGPGRVGLVVARPKPKAQRLLPCPTRHAVERPPRVRAPLTARGAPPFPPGTHAIGGCAARTAGVSCPGLAPGNALTQMHTGGCLGPSIRLASRRVWWAPARSWRCC